jgi:FAD/FMN-containing dehydrogenase
LEHDVMADTASHPAYDIAGLLADIGDVPVVTETGVVRRKSRDYFWYSPLLNKELHGKSADVLIAPRTEADVIKVAAAAAKRRIPVTVRGAATGNYGQAVPLKGGVLLDMTAMDRVLSWKPGVAKLQPGARIHEIDALTRPGGWELRMHPSTGNILAARVVTLEETPRVIDLRGDAAQKVNRAYGTTGIITELEMPLAPAWPWIEMIVAFDDFFTAVKTGHDIALSDGIIKKLISPIVWPIPSYFRDIKEHCPAGKSILICMIAEQSLESFKVALAGRGTITLERAFDESPSKEPLYEYTWNHTTLQLLKVDRSVTYLQCLFPQDRLLESVREMHDLFPDEVLPHLEFIRFGGRLTASALPIVRYTTPERLTEIIALHEKHGVFIANPHVFTLEDGSRHKRADADQLGFKREVDPHGLLNPGKMREYVAVRA